jgi:hypothetical protein
MDSEFTCTILSVLKEDCVKCIRGFLFLEESAAEGLLVQAFYEIDQLEDISEMDRKIVTMASHFGGRKTGQAGLYFGKRRDIDFLFRTKVGATSFKKSLTENGFDSHAQFSKDGVLRAMPSYEDIERQKNTLVQLNCY